MGRPLACRVFGCAWDFHAEDDFVAWTCVRGCGAGGRERVSSTAAAQQLVRRLDRGRPGPPLGLLAALAGTVHRPRNGDRGSAGTG